MIPSKPTHVESERVRHFAAGQVQRDPEQYFRGLARAYQDQYLVAVFKQVVRSHRAFKPVFEQGRHNGNLSSPRRAGCAVGPDACFSQRDSPNVEKVAQSKRSEDHRLNVDYPAVIMRVERRKGSSRIIQRVIGP